MDNTPEIRFRRRLDKEITSMVRQLKEEKRGWSTRKEISYIEFLRDKFLISQIIRQGVSYTFFEIIYQYSPFSERNWAELLNISVKTFQQYRLFSTKFPANQSQKIIELSEVIYAGIDVFNDMADFKRWLDNPNFALGNLKPAELLKDSYGRTMVVEELSRISYGIFV